MLDDIEIIENGVDEEQTDSAAANEKVEETVASTENDNNEEKPSRISDVDEIMADVELVMTREINPNEMEAEIEKSKRKKKKAQESIANKQTVKPEERRAIRRQKRKHDRTVAIIVLCIILVVLSVGGVFGKTFLDSWLAGREKQPEVTVVPTPEIEETEVIDFTPVIENVPEIVEEPEEVTPEVVEPEATPEELLDEMIIEMISQMPLEDKVAGLFIITPEALTGQGNVTKAGEGTKAALEEYPVGGIVYFKANITGADQVKEMISNTQSFSKYPLFFAVDEEGGDVARVQSGLKLEKTPTAAELGEADDPAAVYSSYNTIGNYLTEYGFNLDFAPVADTLTNPDNTAIGKRSFSSDSDVVAKMIPEAVKGLQDAGVSACLKHWPGQGAVDADTHEGVASTPNTELQMEQFEFVPFRAGVDAGVDMIMVGHFAAPEITGDNTPCSLSKEVITGILRDKWEYDGLIITDALNMLAVSEYYGADEAAIKALKSGCDMILMPEDFKLACDGVVDAVRNGTIDEQRINDSLKRVYRVKYANALD